MFQACEVNTANTAAASRPPPVPNALRKNTTVKVRNPSTGTDWRMSSIATSSLEARRSRAAAVP